MAMPWEKKYVGTPDVSAKPKMPWEKKYGEVYNEPVSENKIAPNGETQTVVNPRVMGALPELPEWISKWIPKGEAQTEVAPEIMGGDKYSRGVANVIGGAISGVANAPKNTLETIGAIQGERPEGVIPSLVPSFGKIAAAIPKVEMYDKDSDLGEAAEIVTGYATGAGVATKAIGALKSGATASARLANYAGKLISAEVGGATTMDKDAGTLLYGPSGVLRQWGFDEKGTVDQQTYEKKFNLLMDGLTVGLGAEAGLKVAQKVLGFAQDITYNPIRLWLNPKARNEQIVNDVLHIIGGIEDTDGPEIVAQKMQSVVELLRNNKEEVLKFSDIDPALKDKIVKRDLGTYLTDALKKDDPEGNAALIADVANFSKAAEGPLTEAGKQAPQRALGQGMDEVQELLGPAAGQSDAAAQGIVKGADEQIIRPAQEKLGTLQAAGEDLTKAITDEINVNPMFAEETARLTKSVNTDITKLGDDKAISMTEKLFALGKDMTKKKNDLWDAIRLESQDLDVTGSREKIYNVWNTLSEAAKKKLGGDEFLNRIEATGMNIGELEKIANFDIGLDAIQKAKGQERYALASELLTMKDALTKDQLEYLVKGKKKGTAKVSKTIKDAHEFYNKEFLPWRNNPLLDGIMSAEQGLKGTDRIATGVDVLTKGLDNAGQSPGSRLQVDDFIKFIQKNPTGPKTKEVADYAITRWMEDVQKIINVKGQLEPTDITKMTQSMEQWGTTLKAASPDMAKKFNEFFTSMRDGLLDSKKLDEAIMLGKKEVEQAERYVFDDLLKGLAARDGSIPNSYESFKDMFTSPGNEVRIQKMMELTKDTPQVAAGLKAVFNDILKEGVLFDKSGKLMNSGAKAANPLAIKEFLNDNSSLVKYSKQILGETTTRIYQEASRLIYDVTKMSNAKQELGMTASSFDKNAQVNVNRLITWVWGVLNPKAARIRTITGNYLDQGSKAASVREFIDKINANTDLLADIAEQMIKKNTPVISKENQRLLRKALTRGTIDYLEEDQPEETTTDKQTKEVFFNNEM